MGPRISIAIPNFIGMAVIGLFAGTVLDTWTNIPFGGITLAAVVTLAGLWRSILICKDGVK